MNVKIPVYMHTFTYLCIFTVCKFASVCKNCTFTEIYKYVNLTRDVNLHDLWDNCKRLFARCVNLHGMYFEHVNANFKMHTVQMAISACKMKEKVLIT